MHRTNSLDPYVPLRVSGVGQETSGRDDTRREMEV